MKYINFTACTVFLCAISVVISASEAFPGTGFPHAAAIQFKSEDWTIKDIDHAYEAGFRVIRRGFYWNGIEKEKGIYDFSAWDAQMNHAKEKGMRIIGCFFSNNKLHENDKEGGIQTESGRKGFAAWAAACAVHYKDHDVVWEIWNEPNVRTFWRKSGRHNSKEFAAEYSALVNEVAPTMLKANPHAIILAGSVSNYWKPSYEWTEFCFQNGVLKSGITGWSVHPYGVKRPEDFAIGHKITQDLLKKYGAPNMPMVNTERGFAVKEHREGWSGGDKNHVYNYQAWHLIRQYMIDQLYGLKHTVWYEWRDDSFGLMDTKDQKRPAYQSAITMMKELDGFQLDKQLSVNFELDYVLRFVNGKGQAKLVAWTAQPRGGTPDEFRAHKITLPITSGKGSYSVDGSAAQSLGTELSLDLHAKPIFVTLPDSITFAAGIADVKPIETVNENQNIPDNAKHLPVFDQDAKWIFKGGKGSFKVNSGEHGGTALGVLNYDFSAHNGKGRPSVYAATNVKIEHGSELRIHAKSDVRQQLTFRLTDSTGQTLQYKAQIKGTGKFEAVRLNLKKKTEAWGGKKDGKVHFPIKKLLCSVPLPSEEHKTGSVTYTDIVIID